MYAMLATPFWHTLPKKIAGAYIHTAIVRAYRPRQRRTPYSSPSAICVNMSMYVCQLLALCVMLSLCPFGGITQAAPFVPVPLGFHVPESSGGKWQNFPFVVSAPLCTRGVHPHCNVMQRGCGYLMPPTLRHGLPSPFLLSVQLSMPPPLSRMPSGTFLCRP